jgi:hypothetical protein
MVKPSNELTEARYYIRCMTEKIRSGDFDDKYLRKIKKKINKKLDDAIALAKDGKFY